MTEAPRSPGETDPHEHTRAHTSTHVVGASTRQTGRHSSPPTWRMLAHPTHRCHSTSRATAHTTRHRERRLPSNVQRDNTQLHTKFRGVRTPGQEVYARYIELGRPHAAISSHTSPIPTDHSEEEEANSPQLPPSSLARPRPHRRQRRAETFPSPVSLSPAR